MVLLILNKSYESYLGPEKTILGQLGSGNFFFALTCVADSEKTGRWFFYCYTLLESSVDYLPNQRFFFRISLLGEFRGEFRNFNSFSAFLLQS